MNKPLPDLELRLLQAFLVLIQEKNMRRASEILGISQAAMSRGLTKLRLAFDDPLFVSTARGMEPTSRALGAHQALAQIVALATEQLEPLAPFDPSVSSRQFSIAASDVGEFLIIPTLVRACMDLPGVRFHAQRLAIRNLPNELQSGTVDVAIGAFPALEAGIRCRRLFTERYVCLARRDHPSVQGEMTMQQFLGAQHIVVSAKVLGHAHERIERKLLQMLPPGAAKVTSSSFLLSALVMSETDCVLVAPSTLGRLMGQHAGYQILPLPMENETFEIQLYWHERSQHDPAHQWLRNLIVGHFEER